VAFRDSLLGTRTGYSLFRKLIKADRGMKRLVDDYLLPQPGQTVIDLGCGTGDLAQFIPASTRYIGVDHNPAYLAPSSITEGLNSGRRVFINADLGELNRLDLPPADSAFALGVLHHLTDSQALKMIESAMSLLVSGGTLVTVDPVFVPQQASSARVMMALDRGRFVRQVEHYRFLFDQVRPGATMHLRSDINPFPYNHIVFVLEK